MYEASNYYNLFIKKQLKANVKTYPGPIHEANPTFLSIAVLYAEKKLIGRLYYCL